MEQLLTFVVTLILVSISKCNAQQNIYASKQVYLESITKGSEFSCMKGCVPPDRKRYVDESFYTGPDPRPSSSCEKLSERSVDAATCKMSTALTSSLTYIAGSMFMLPNLTSTSSVKMTWHAAMKFCRGFGISMQLASIVNEKENNGIAKFLNDQKPPISTNIAKDAFWTSGSNLADEFIWMESGEKISYFNWVGGKPSGTVKTCIQAALDKGKMVWKDVECSTENRVICEVNDECYKNWCDDV